MKALAGLVAIVLAMPSAQAQPAPVDGGALVDPHAILPNGLALPYPTLRVFRAFGRCLGRGKKPARLEGKWKSHDHEGIDLGGLGPESGLGTAVRSLTKARVTTIARVTDDPHRYGVPDLRAGEVSRDGTVFPRAFELAGYGLVHFFTRNRGYWRTGNMVVTVGLEGPLEGHEIRYLHLGAPRPDLAVGDVVVPGEEIGVLGGTAVQDADPHVHVDMRDRDGEAVDVAPLIGLQVSAWCGVPRVRALADRAAFQAAAAGRDWRPVTWLPPAGVVGREGRTLPAIDLLRTPPALVAAGIVPARARFWHELTLPAACGTKVVEEDFASGAYAGHAWRIPVGRRQVLDLSVTPNRFEVLVGEQRASEVEPEIATVKMIDDHARVHLEIHEARDVTVAILAPSSPGPVGYRLTINDRCVAHR